MKTKKHYIDIILWCEHVPYVYLIWHDLNLDCEKGFLEKACSLTSETSKHYLQVSKSVFPNNTENIQMRC